MVFSLVFLYKDRTDLHFLFLGPCHQRVAEEAGTPSKALIRREILKHVMRMCNPVWIKVSKQTLLQ
jgi:hypothetical protein